MRTLWEIRYIYDIYTVSILWSTGVRWAACHIRAVTAYYTCFYAVSQLCNHLSCPYSVVSCFPVCSVDRDAVCCPRGRGANVCSGQTTHRNILAPDSGVPFAAWFLALSCIFSSICTENSQGDWREKHHIIRYGHWAPWTCADTGLTMTSHTSPDGGWLMTRASNEGSRIYPNHGEGPWIDS